MFFENCIHVNNVSRAYPPMLEWVSPPTPCPLLFVLCISLYPIRAVHVYVDVGSSKGTQAAYQ